MLPCMQVGQWASAKECYSRSLLLEPSSLAFANRAMAELKLNDWPVSGGLVAHVLRDQLLVYGNHKPDAQPWLYSLACLRRRLRRTVARPSR